MAVSFVLCPGVFVLCPDVFIQSFVIAISIALSALLRPFDVCGEWLGPIRSLAAQVLHGFGHPFNPAVWRVCHIPAKTTTLTILSCLPRNILNRVPIQIRFGMGG